MAVRELFKRHTADDRTNLLQSTPNLWLWVVRIGVVIGVIALSILIGMLMAGNLIIQIVAMAIPLLLIAPFAAIWFSGKLEWGVLLIIITAGVTPFTLPTGTDSRIADSMVIAAGLIALWVIRMLVVSPRFKIVQTAVNLPAFGFMVVVIISLLWSFTFRDPQVLIWDSFPIVQVASAVVMVVLPATMVFVINFGRNELIIKLAVWFLLAVGALGLINNWFNFHIINTRGLFSTWVVALGLGLALFHEKLPMWVRFGLVVLVAVWVYYAFVIGITWLAGWLPMFLAGGIALLIRSRKLTLLVVLVVAVVALLNLEYFETAFESERAISGVTRLDAWAVNWRITGQHPIFGTGPGGYAAYYMYYYPNEGMATHSNYIDVLAQTGLVGMFFYLWLFGVLAWRGFKLWRRLAGRRDFYEAMAVAMLGGTVACIFIMAFGDWLLPFAYTQTIAGFDYAVYSWFFLGIMIALDKMTEPAALEQPADA